MILGSIVWYYSFTEKNIEMEKIMTLAEFRTKIKNELQHGDKKVAFMHIKNEVVDGNMCYTKEEALTKCREIVNSPEFGEGSELSIAIYNDSNIEVLGNSEVLLSLNMISMLDYHNETSIFI